MHFCLNLFQIIFKDLFHEDLYPTVEKKPSLASSNHVLHTKKLTIFHNILRTDIHVFELNLLLNKTFGQILYSQIVGLCHRPLMIPYFYKSGKPFS